MANTRVKEKDIEVITNSFPTLSILSKKEYDILISALELEIRNYYKEQNSTKKVPP